MKKTGMLYAALATLLAAQGCAGQSPARSGTEGSAPTVLLGKGKPRVLDTNEIKTLGSGVKYMRFYKNGSPQTGTLLCIIAFEHPGTWDGAMFGHNIPCANDQATSMAFDNANAGTRVLVFDSPGAGGTCLTHGDDWTEIILRGTGYSASISSFEVDRDDSTFYVKHHRHNGLNGKVSCFKLVAT